MKNGPIRCWKHRTGPDHPSGTSGLDSCLTLRDAAVASQWRRQLDYERVYREFILDREASPPGVDEYAEIHHILPRCMGGGDDPANLIRLRAGDHFFAHLCLAKAYDLPLLWGAVFLMLNGSRNRRGSRSHIAGRRAYEWLAHRRPSGDAHPRSDKARYHFRHVDGRELFCTRTEFAGATGIVRIHLAQLIVGSLRSLGGWYLPDRNPDGLVGHSFTTGDKNGFADKEDRFFRHRDGREFFGTRAAFSRASGLKRSQVDGLVRGLSLVAGGWYLPEKNPDGQSRVERYAGAANNKFNPEIYHFQHEDGRSERSTLYEMHRKHGGARPSWNGVLKGHALKGWRLVGASPRLRTGRGAGKQYRFIHADGRVFTGTQKAFSEMAGCGAPSACRVAKGQQIYQGWRLDDRRLGHVSQGLARQDH